MPVPEMPRRFGWLQHLVPDTHMSAGRLSHLLQQPEMAAMFAAAPQVGRIRRPLCQILGVRMRVLGTELPPGLERPRRPLEQCSWPA
jgi:hypothetical protein